MTIPQRILLHVAAGAALVIAVVTAVTYGIVYEGAKQRDLKHLETYVRERARREEIGFKQVEANLNLVRGQFLKRMEGPLPRNIDGQWDERFELFPDGAWRSRTNFVDGRKYSTLWSHKDVAFTPELKTEILRAQNICDELLPGWVDEFPSVYFVFPGWLNIGFDPRIPAWVWDTPADYNATNLEWFDLAIPQQLPTDRFAWTGVIEEPTTKVPIVSAYLPIFKDGKFLGSLGHDKYVNRMMDEITRSDLPGARHVIFRPDGRIIGHPTKLKEILASKGLLQMQNSGEPDLVSLYRAVKPRTEHNFSDYDEGSKCYYSGARLAGPDWFFLTTMPRELLQKQAFQSAQWVLWSGLVSLALVLAFLAATLRKQIALPLMELTRATKQMSAGDVSVRASVGRDDELGELAGAFNEMTGRVAQRDAELQAEKASLERRVAERTAELSESEARFVTAFRHSPAMQSLIRGSDRVLIEVNDTFLSKLGFTREHVIGKAAPELNFWADPAELADFAQEVETKGFVLGREVRLRASDGRVLTVLLSTQPVDIGGALHFLSAGVDITARKEAEAKLLEGERALRDSEARFRRVFHNSPAMQSVLRVADNVLVEVNDSFLNQLGYRRDEVIGKSPFDLNAPEEHANLAAYRQKLDEQGFVQNYEIRLRARDGHFVTALLSTYRVNIDGVPHFVNAGVDITARKEAEAKLIASERQLRESEARFGKAFQTNPVLMTIARLSDGKFVEINPAFMRHIGVDRANIIGKDSKELGLWVDLNARADFFKRLKQDRVVRDVECQIRTQRGTIHTMEISGEIIELNGEPHLITFALDVTQTKQAEAELQNALAKERELSQLKSDFVSLVSHEFRTPLEIIMSSVDNLDRYYERLPAEKRQQLLHSINKAVRRMAGMMEEVLVLGRLETDRVTFQPAALDLPLLCRRISDEIESATGKRCPIDLQIEGDMAGAVGDEGLLRHIFTNLLSNAVKYSQAGHRAEFVVRRDDDEAVCAIVDHGCGIPQADQARLFQAFHRGSNVEQIPGTGLGLLIVQRCVELHGGKIGFESVEGQGTTFTVELPLFTKPVSDSNL